MVKKAGEPAAKREFHCPYCDEGVQQAKLPWCQACGVKLVFCEKCGRPIAKDKAVCPHCGTKTSAK